MSRMLVEVDEKAVRFLAAMFIVTLLGAIGLSVSGHDTAAMIVLVPGYTVVTLSLCAVGFFSDGGGWNA